MDTENCRRLVASIIGQAVEDVRSLENSGHLILAGGFLEMNPKLKTNPARSCGYAKPAEISNLLHFFGAPLKLALTSAGLNISPESIREKLKLKPTEKYA